MADMGIRLYRVDERSLWARAWKPAAAVVGGTVLLPISLPFTALGLTAAAVASSWGDDVVVLRGREDIARFRFPDGRTPQADTVYAEHPRRARFLVPLPELRTFLLREQVADLIAYCRSMLRLTE